MTGNRRAAAAAALVAGALVIVVPWVLPGWSAFGPACAVFAWILAMQQAHQGRLGGVGRVMRWLLRSVLVLLLLVILVVIVPLLLSPAVHDGDSIPLVQKYESEWTALSWLLLGLTVLVGFAALVLLAISMTAARLLPRWLVWLPVVAVPIGFYVAAVNGDALPYVFPGVTMIFVALMALRRSEHQTAFGSE